jgi:hypothetical protein
MTSVRFLDCSTQTQVSGRHARFATHARDRLIGQTALSVALAIAAAARLSHERTDVETMAVECRG